MPQPPSDADARFDRTVDRWFRDRLRLEPELATYLGKHDLKAAGLLDPLDEGMFQSLGQLQLESEGEEE